MGFPSPPLPNVAPDPSQPPLEFRSPSPSTEVLNFLLSPKSTSFWALRVSVQFCHLRQFFPTQLPRSSFTNMTWSQPGHVLPGSKCPDFTGDHPHLAGVVTQTADSARVHSPGLTGDLSQAGLEGHHRAECQDGSEPGVPPWGRVPRSFPSRGDNSR